MGIPQWSRVLRVIVPLSELAESLARSLAQSGRSLSRGHTGASERASARATERARLKDRTVSIFQARALDPVQSSLQALGNIIVKVHGTYISLMGLSSLSARLTKSAERKTAPAILGGKTIDLEGSRTFTKATNSLKALLEMEELDIIAIQGNYTLLEEKANLVHSLDQEIFQHLIETEATEEDLINEVEVVDDYKQHTRDASNMKLQSHSLISNEEKSGNGLPNVILQTLKVRIVRGSSLVETRALFDTGSQRSYILESVAEKLGYPCQRTETLRHSLFGGEEGGGDGDESDYGGSQKSLKSRGSHKRVATPTPFKESNTDMRTVTEVCKTFGLTDMEVEYTEAEFLNFTAYKLFQQHVRPLLSKENPGVLMSKLTMLVAAKWRDFTNINPNMKVDNESAVEENYSHKSSRYRQSKDKGDADLDLNEEEEEREEKKKKRSSSRKKPGASIKKSSKVPTLKIELGKRKRGRSKENPTCYLQEEEEGEPSGNSERDSDAKFEQMLAETEEANKSEDEGGDDGAESGSVDTPLTSTRVRSLCSPLDHRENAAFVVPWIIGFITFMALEAVAMVYSNVLRDHVNKQFDALCKAEMAFFISRAFLNIISLYGVTQFYNMLRMGISWKGPEAIELLGEGGKIAHITVISADSQFVIRQILLTYWIYRKNTVIVPLYKGKGARRLSNHFGYTIMY
uniref:CHD N-terminal domain-containing protein n=1 Tax=Timema shepardi TaxID=629360 RepID=A0A7R9AX87_TIMSH|nr:unnamed protein product [Timema shepardi]